jgi:hypothetical protein
MTGIFSERGGLLLNIKIRFLNQAGIVTDIHTFSVHMCVMTQGIVEWIDPLFFNFLFTFIFKMSLLFHLFLCVTFSCPCPCIWLHQHICTDSKLGTGGSSQG